MIISFANRELRSICENEFEAKDMFGANVALKLKNRISDIIAAKTINDLVSGSPTEIEGGCYKVNLADNFVLKFCSSHTKTPTLTCDKINWASVSRIKIIEIINE